MNNDPQTAAQHNAPQTGEVYSTVKPPAIQLGYEELLAMANYARLPGVSMVYKNDVPRLLAEREALVKERDTLHEHLSVMKARNLMRGIRSACEKCGHENNEDGCAHCLREQPKIGVTALISDSNGRILLGLKGRAFNSGFVGKWVTPGGRVQKGETLVLAIVREVKEETGLLVKVVTALPQRELIHPNGHFVFSVFQAVVIGGKESAGDDLREVRWFSKCDLELLKDDMTPLTRDIVFAKPPDAERLREQVTKLREALEYIGGKTNHGHSPHGRCIICATVDKAIAQTEAR